MTRGGRLLNMVSDGECFGEMAYIARRRGARHATVESHTDVLLAEFEPAALDKMSLGAQLQLTRALVRNVVERLALANYRHRAHTQLCACKSASAVAILESRLGRAARRARRAARRRRRSTRRRSPSCPTSIRRRSRALVRSLEERPAKLAIFQTGVGTRALFAATDALGLTEKLSRPA